MRCPNCGGITEHYVVQVDGSNLYKCGTTRTSGKVQDPKADNKVQKIEFQRCGTVVDHKGVPFHGFASYMNGAKLEHFRCNEGTELQ